MYTEYNVTSMYVIYLKEMEKATITEIVTFVKQIVDITDLESIANKVFANSDISCEEGAALLRQSIEYYEEFNTSHKSVSIPGNRSYTSIQVLCVCVCVCIQYVRAYTLL